MALTIPTIFTAIDKFSSPLSKMGDNTEAFANRAERSFRKVGSISMDIAKKSFLVGAAVVTPLALAANAAINFEDKMSDVAKTTGLQGVELEEFGETILGLATKTRTSINDLVKIAEIGGQLGIAKGDLTSFTVAADKFNIALGKDFTGGVEQAVAQVGKIKTLFSDTRNVNIADAIMKTGSAINELGAVGAGTSFNISDFTLRLGALPDALKPSISNTLALGTYLEELGIDAQIGAGGMTNFLLVAGKNISGFASQMKIGSIEAKALLAQDPTEFSKKFASSLKGVAPDVLANKLDKLGINSQETIKVIGALGSGTARLTELQLISNKAFTEGISLETEAAKKQATTAAQMAIAKNNIEALTITIGTQLLPVINKLFEKITPIIKSVMNWVKENKELTKNIVTAALIIGGFAFIVSTVAFAIALVSKTIAIAMSVTRAYAAVQLFLNAAMMANPLGVFIAVMLVLIGIIVLIIKYWNEWGASLAAVIGVAALFFNPFIAAIMLIISLIQSFRRNWDMIAKAFKEGGILSGLLAIGKTIFDAILMPLQQLLGIVAKLTGFDWAADASKSIEKFRADMGVNITTDENGDPLPVKEPINPKQVQAEYQSTINNNTSEKITFDFVNMPSGIKVGSDNKNSSVMPSMSSTMQYNPQ